MIVWGVPHESVHVVETTQLPPPVGVPEMTTFEAEQVAFRPSPPQPLVQAVLLKGLWPPETVTVRLNATPCEPLNVVPDGVERAMLGQLDPPEEGLTVSPNDFWAVQAPDCAGLAVTVTV